MEEQQHYHSDEDDEHYSSDDESISSTESTPEPHHTKSTKEFKQHLFAVLIAILAAITTHTQLHGGYGAWKSKLIQDWNAIRSKGRQHIDKTRIPRASSGGGAPHAAPAMNGIPSEMRQEVLKQALGTEEAVSPIGHERASSFRRTADLQFCSTATFTSESDERNLVDLDFILPLVPSVRVLHSYYLGDAVGTDSSFVYDNNARFGSFDSDVIMTEIDEANALDGDEEGLSLERVRSIVESHLDKTLVNDEHVCLLQQYTANKKHGRSIRGRTKAYKQPHVSTFYRKDPSTSNALSASRESKSTMEEASLTFTGFATKFINLSVQPLNLYWDGGHISTGPRAGQFHTSFVGTIPSMESIGTASFPGHSFFVTPTYDKDHMLRRWAVTEDDAVLYYDPLEDLSMEDQQREVQKLCDAGKWSLKQKFARDAWIVNRSFGRDYLVKTGKHWLSVFPQPIASHVNSAADKKNSGYGSTIGLSMWNTDYLGQVHTVETSELYFTSVPNELPRLTKDDFRPDVERQRRLEMTAYRSSQVKTNTLVSNSTMQLNLKVVSCAPRVIEVKKFLSPVEAQHLIYLASGTKGDVSMRTSTVMASGVKGSASKQDTRSSTGGWIHREQDVIVDGIFRRVANLLDVDERMMRDQRPSHLIGTEDNESLPTHDRLVEAMQLLRYSEGEQYTAHHDFTYPSIENRYQPKRYATVLLYLTGEGDVIEDGILRPKKSSMNSGTSDGLVGGETTFPRAITTEFHDGVKVQPQTGKAILFYNVLADGNMDDLSQHSGGIVEGGVKYVANIWVWDPIIA